MNTYHFFVSFFSRDNCDGGTSAIETGHIFKEVAEKFLRDHPNDFCGIRMIYAPIRSGICVKYFLSFPQKNLSPEKTETN